MDAAPGNHGLTVEGAAWGGYAVPWKGSRKTERVAMVQLADANLVLFMGASLALIATPGQDNHYILTRGVAQGRPAALVFAWGGARRAPCPHRLRRGRALRGTRKFRAGLLRGQVGGRGLPGLPGREDAPRPREALAIPEGDGEEEGWAFGGSSGRASSPTS